MGLLTKFHMHALFSHHTCFSKNHITVRKMVCNLIFEGLFRDSYDMSMNVRICNCYKLYGNVNTGGLSKFCVRAS